ncbi:peptidoglycan-recognition protein SC2-like [Malaya genurostris]|uniref:peptidoglycan-recognition protein SC2-like n=1 Tax=Malaya genurostris TaxID=325434 RepID=UPI0026F391DB|nr:peptidoglycan-recognition protein SC2-like [Malaya genurostris]
MKKFAIPIAVIITSLIGSMAQCPRIISREDWGARAATSAVLPNRPASWVVVHHTAGAHCSTDSGCAQQMRNIQSYHIDGNGWTDIGYNWCIGENGAAYEGRGWGRLGAHAPGYNDRSVGICLIGTFTDVVPNGAALRAVQSLIQCGISLGHIDSSYWLIGHRQAGATACPGDALFREIGTWSRFNSTA